MLKKSKEVEFSHIVCLSLKSDRTFVTLYLMLPMPQKWFTSINKWGRYGVFGVKCSVFNDQWIKID